MVLRKIKLYIAISLNGKIADADGNVHWLESIPNPDKSDHGYADFYNSIDTTIQGNNTYNQIINWGIEFLHFLSNVEPVPRTGRISDRWSIGPYNRRR